MIIWSPIMKINILYTMTLWIFKRRKDVNKNPCRKKSLTIKNDNTILEYILLLGCILSFLTEISAYSLPILASQEMSPIAQNINLNKNMTRDMENGKKITAKTFTAQVTTIDKSTIDSSCLFSPQPIYVNGTVVPGWVDGRLQLNVSWGHKEGAKKPCGYHVILFNNKNVKLCEVYDIDGNLSSILLPKSIPNHLDLCRIEPNDSLVVSIQNYPPIVDDNDAHIIYNKVYVPACIHGVCKCTAHSVIPKPIVTTYYIEGKVNITWEVKPGFDLCFHPSYNIIEFKDNLSSSLNLLARFPVKWTGYGLKSTVLKNVRVEKGKTYHTSVQVVDTNRQYSHIGVFISPYRLYGDGYTISVPKTLFVEYWAGPVVLLMVIVSFTILYKKTCCIKRLIGGQIFTEPTTNSALHRQTAWLPGHLAESER